MTSRLSSPGTPADHELANLLDHKELSGFVVTAGAGSGKTTSLVKALAHVVDAHGAELKSRSQRIACITYTEVAAYEIHADVGNNPLIEVSTIHSFLWNIVKPFHSNIAEWVKARVEDKISDLLSAQQAFTGRTRTTTIEKNADDLNKYKQQLEKLPLVSRFRYEMGSDYANGILGHEDILNLAPDLIQSKPLLARIVATRFPYIFVDESQDTFTNVVACLKRVRAEAHGKVSLGFFGDPMQRIYQRSTGTIELEGDWKKVDKPENFRSSKRVLEVVNRVRADADGLTQLAGGSASNKLEGETFFFVLPADELRSERLQLVRTWLDKNSNAGSWTATEPEHGAKILLIVHRMAARRLGFGTLFNAFSDNGSSRLKDSFEEGTAWPLRPFLDVILPICANNISEAAVIAILHRSSKLLSPELTSRQVRANIVAARDALEELRGIVEAGGPGSVGSALESALTNGLASPDARFEAFFQPDGEHGDVVLSESTLATLHAFLACDVHELSGYRRYINQDSPYSTQHGTKGSEFQKVVVVLDDDEGKYNLYSYEKLFGIKPLSATDKINQVEGGDSAVERTRRLLYVCVSRAIESLCVVMFSGDVAKAKSALEASGLADGSIVRVLADLDGPT